MVRDFVLTVAAGVVLCLVIIVVANLDAISAGMRLLGEVLLTWLMWTLGTLTVGGLVAGGVILYMAYRGRAIRERRAVDGSFPLQTFKRGGVTVLVDPNKMISGAGVYHPDIGFRELDPAGGWDRHLLLAQAVQVTRTAEAIAPGDEAIQGMPGYRAPSISRAALASTNKPGKPLVPTEPEETLSVPSVQPLSLYDAIRDSGPERFILGQGEDGALCTVNPRTAVHLGLVGAPGCGKTVSSGYQVALAGLKAGYQLVILDGKGGMDWRPWSELAEWYQSDARSLPDQFRSIYEEYQRRMALAKRHQVGHVSELRRSDVPPVLVIVEEYGNMRLRMKKAESDFIEQAIDDMSQAGRATDIHFAFIDQYPKQWSELMMMATKAKLVYKMGPNQGNVVGDWHAEQLPDVGVFRHNRQEYNAWHVAPSLPKLLASAPRRTFPALIDGRYTVKEPVKDDGGSHMRSVARSFGGSEGVSPEVDPPPGDETNGTNDETRQAIYGYLDEHPEASQAEIRRELGTSKGYTSECWHAWHQMQPQTVAAQTVPDARNGARVLLDMNDPAHARELERIRQEIAAGKVSVG